MLRDWCTWNQDYNQLVQSIRRYLEELEDENKLKRVYGGAVKINLSREELSQLKREVLYAEEKRMIGRAAASR